MRESREAILLAQVWRALGGAPSALDAVTFDGPSGGLPSVYATEETAAAQVAAATLAVAEFHAARTEKDGPLRRVRIERAHVIAAFRSERYLRPVGWEASGAFDPIIGDYETRNGWVRLHTNYAWHREAALRVLGTPNDRASVTAAVRSWEADALERAVVTEGGAAAAMRTTAEWNAHPQGHAVAGEPLVHFARSGSAVSSLAQHATAPLDGVRVLDLTRVIAGPVCTRVLAAYGANVMRIDPPRFEEVRALLADTTAGKRRVALDLHAAEDRRTFEGLVADAHVLVTGYRADALERLGYSMTALRAQNPGLICVSLDAYGWTGPWKDRRGFDSLVQMSSGIAARGREAAAASRPTPLPAQALDHGTGYLLAAATCRALTRQIEEGGTYDVHASLARTASWLMSLGDEGNIARPDFTAADASRWLERAPSAWGALDRVRCPGSIEGIATGWTRPAGPLGTDAAVW